MKLGIVIILYHPDEAHIRGLVQAYSNAGLPVVLVDNSPAPFNLTELTYSQYLHNPDNAGIARAQNQGIEALLSLGCRYVLILDQDSKLACSDIEKLASHFRVLESAGEPVAAIGPTVHCSFSDKLVVPKVNRHKAVSETLVNAKQLIASGMLLSAAAYSRIGGKEESLFIDGVDHEWCWRARHQGFSLFQAKDVVMPHRQGDARIRLCGVIFKVGAPVRLYYQVRNVLLLSRRGYVPTYWKVRNFLALPLRYLANRWFMENGKQRGVLMRKGFVDGCCKRSGKLTE
ncbi:glycosyltransferase family 2 protein [Alteromonas sp. CYL-A6]|uniref:glycosyltransferase family 2 protein n=1 Tax=Alteromonas nitratireducens TaxID=3390813 RepID=UPI0034B6BD7A